MNDNLYTKEIIEDICQEISLDGANAPITNLLGNNLTLYEEVWNLKREHEIQSVRLCEVMEQKGKGKE